MATESVATPTRFDRAERASEIIHKSRGLAELIRSSAVSTSPADDESLAAVAWTLGDMLREADELVASLGKEG